MRAVRDDRRLVNFRIDLARALVSLGFVILIGTYWYLQFIKGSYYRSLSENNRLRSLPIHAVRGVILDRHGRVLTENEPAFNLLLYRREVRDLPATNRFLASGLGLEADEVDQRLARAKGTREFVPVRLAEDVDPETVATTEAHSPEHPELAIEITEKRRYKDSPRAAHILGYLGEPSPDQIRKEPERFRSGDPVGLAGIEAVYNARLAGTPGERTVVVDSLGREVIEAAKKGAVAGRSLPLSIDLRLQAIAESYFADKVGAAVALDPNTGEILTLVSSPDFDPNAFVGRVSQEEWGKLIGDDRHPLQNRVIQNAYSPGSIFKIVMAYAGLEKRVIRSDEKIFCPGSASFYGNVYRCHKAGGHGLVDMRRALEVSCDVYFYNVGRRLGIDAIAEAAVRFGLGSPTGIDLMGEKKGLVPSEAWSRSARRQPWYAGETISVAIGQGPLLVTPIQMARMIAAVANGGRLIEPHLAALPVVDAAKRQRPYPAAPAIAFSPGNLEVIKDGLFSVVNGGSGTAAVARVAGLDVCGKTGTVQVVRQKKGTKSENLPYKFRDHAWFVAFAPRENPRLALAIFVEHGGHGGSVAAPLAAELFRAYLLDQWPAERPAVGERPEPDEPEPGFVPGFEPGFEPDAEPPPVVPLATAPVVAGSSHQSGESPAGRQGGE